jgi:hypothetical protein
MFFILKIQSFNKSKNNILDFFYEVNNTTL